MKVVQNPVSKIIASGFLVMGIILPASVMSAGNQEEPFVYLVKYDITGPPNQDGRVVPMWGPVINSNFNPDGSSTPVRILGCGGLKEISNEGDFAGMVGSICFNGVFNLPDFQTNISLSGGSDCTTTLHTPVVPIP